MHTPCASIDLGTNSARLLIGFTDPTNGIRPLLLKRKITRLGGGFSKENGLSLEARRRSLAVLHDFALEIQRHGVSQIRAVATSAVRDAVNGNDFIAEVFQRTGILLEVIDGREEGLLTLRGIFSGIRAEGDVFIFDIGGGSTEYTLARDETPLFTKSLPLGVVRLTEGKRSIPAMEDKINRELEALLTNLAQAGYPACAPGTRLIGTAGTPTTLAGIDLGVTDYAAESVHGHVLSLEVVRNIYERILPLTPEQSLLVPGIEKGREDLILAGTLITLRTMERFGFDYLTVSESGLLEGLLLTL
ncbi:MAG: exopolyphosphatase [Deltaproteobacteria bacterium]|nr:exopolyphosphatase [Deltaproteobacteria bacterium]TLN04486.1 MAG: exopolyphosphatase [bacterium]